MKVLVSADESKDIDKRAQTEWGFNSFSLIEIASRNCARVLLEYLPGFLDKTFRQVLVFAGTGNNGADALAMLRSWILSGLVKPANAVVHACGIPDKASVPGSLFFSLDKMKVPIILWEKSQVPEIKIMPGCLVLDGIAGTGIRCPLDGIQLSMVQKINELTDKKNFPDSWLWEQNLQNEVIDSETVQTRPLVVSVDLPSGLGDNWKTGMPAVNADITLAIEPQKHCLYNPAARPCAGKILPVSGIFPSDLVESKNAPLLLDWDFSKKLIPRIKSSVHKYDRGCVEIHAGSAGAAGAAIIAARGAQAAGAGLVRLITDNEIYPIIAGRAGGIMVCPKNSAENLSGRFRPDSILLGPGWGRGPDRRKFLEDSLESEKSGLPLILDADAIFLAKEMVFGGNTIITPHVGEFAVYTGLHADDILNDPMPILQKTALEKNVFILLKSHVMLIISPDGRQAVLDGMSPNLACGGSGDLLAGIIAALAARMARAGMLDLFSCIASGASLFIRAAGDELVSRFLDPLELADRVADIAGKAWLYPDIAGYINREAIQ